MINYMKSELYKITHTRETYVWTGVMAAIAILTNIILAVSNSNIENFRYGSTRFAISILVESADIFLYGAVIMAALVCNGESKNGTWKNVVAYGISKEAALAGKCIAGVITAICCMTVVVTVYFTSAVLLLEGPWIEVLNILLHEIGAVLLISIGAEILGIALMQVLKNEYVVAAVWVMVIIVLPKSLMLLGMGLNMDVLNKISEWLPTNFLSMEVRMSRSEYYALWDTAQGMAKCLIAGAGSIVIYMAGGLLAVRHREV